MTPAELLAAYDAERVEESQRKLHVGDWVQAVTSLCDGMVRAGSVGEVMAVASLEAPAMVYWHAEDDYTPVEVDDVEVLCEAGFAGCEARTPKRAQTAYVRRGAM